MIPQYDELNESFSHNHMTFDPLDMVECWLMVNNARVPNVSYTMNFPNKDYYSRLYAALLEAVLNINAET